MRCPVTCGIRVRRFAIVVGISVGEVLDLALMANGDRRDETELDLSCFEFVDDVQPEVGGRLHVEKDAVESALLSERLDPREKVGDALAGVTDHETRDRDEVATGN